MNKLSKEKKQQLILVAMGTVGIMAAIYFFLISAQLAEVSKTKRETEATQKKVEVAEGVLKTADEVEKAAAARAQQLEKYESQMASGDMKEWIMNTLRQVKIAHPDLPDFRIGSEASVPVGILPVFPYSAVQFEVRGNGYFHDLGKFFNDFENSLPFFRIQNLVLEPGDPSLSVDHESLVFKADFVVLLKPEPTVAAPSPKPK